MALAAATVLEIQTGGSDTNGGGFVTGSSGTDWSQQVGPQYSVVDGVTAGTTTITSATANFGTDVVGNLMYVQGGTGAVVAGWYQIVTWNSASSVTVDRATGLTAGTGVTLKIGGALLSVGQACAIATVVGNIMYNKNGSYTIANGTVNTSGQKYSISSGVLLVGYGTNRTLTNTDTPPVHNAGAANMVMGTLAGNQCGIRNINVTNSSAFATVTGIANSNNEDNIEWCLFSGLATPVNMNGVGGVMSDCYFSGCGPLGTAGPAFKILRCTFINGTGTSITMTGAGYLVDECIIYNGAGIGVTVSANSILKNSLIYGMTGNHAGVQMTGSGARVYNTISYGNTGTGKGFDRNTISGTVLYNCAAGGNGGANFDTNFTAAELINTVTLTGDPIIAPASNNFALNNTAGAGALCRGVGIPGTFNGLGSSTTGYRDLGAVDHQTLPGGGSLSRIFSGF
jgi:hypothetical protein